MFFLVSVADNFTLASNIVEFWSFLRFRFVFFQCISFFLLLVTDNEWVKSTYAFFWTQVCASIQNILLWVKYKNSQCFLQFFVLRRLYKIHRFVFRVFSFQSWFCTSRRRSSGRKTFKKHIQKSDLDTAASSASQSEPHSRLYKFYVTFHI